MDVATGPLSTLLPKLAKLLQDEYNLQRSTRKGIEFLHRELEFMHAVLRKIGEVPREQLDELQTIWARDVRELSYDMEDIIETFMVDIKGPDHPSKRGVKKIFMKMIREVTKALARHEVAQEINDIKEHAKELAERRERYKVDDITSANKTPIDPRLKALYTKETEIVGIKEAKEEVIKMLMEVDGGKRKRIVSIAGFGGLGKTTLAKYVHDEIKVLFDCTAFVSVSRDPDTQKLIKDMLYQLDEKKFEDIHSKVLDERFLIDKAIEFLKDKRYLIVIDDIWDKEPWDRVIGLALIENNMRSRIITTTRIIDVAEHVGSCYKLKPLSNESSEKLFYGRIFGSKDTCPTRFLDVCGKILKKCGGVPLAIVTTSSLLANKSEEIRDWYDVCESIGLGLGNNPGMNDMRNILLLSYYDLSSHLKTCLLYLSIFPEDYKISKNVLIQTWVAEGFVQQTDSGQSFLEIGESYFNELLNRSLIQPADMDYIDGTPHACRLHDTILDLVISLSTKECFIATVLLEDGKHYLESNNQVRWLSLHNNTTWPTMKMAKLRSLTIFKPDVVVIDPTLFSLSRYLLLRVLDLRGCKLKDIASIGFLGSLSHLRYLAMSSSNIHGCDQLPIEIGKLRFLQMLDLSGTAVREMPSSVVTGLGQLMCLQGSWCSNVIDSTDLPDGLKNLTSLEVLQHVAVTSEHIAEELGHLTQLRVLDVTIRLSPYDDDEWNRCTGDLVESLGKLTKMESLSIYHYWLELDLDGPMEEPLGNLRRLYIYNAEILPAWIEPTLLPGISYLDIYVYYEQLENIKVLSTLPCLRHLSYRVGGHESIPKPKICVVGPDAFPSAIWCKFDIHGLGVVPHMFQGGAIPRLQDFTFRIELGQFCSGGEFTLDDLGLGHLPSLQSVTVLCMDDIDDEEDDPDDEEDNYEEDIKVITSVRAKLKHEAAVHPKGPLRIEFSADD